MINEQGGVNGRKLTLVSLDDAYSAPKTVEQTRRLIEQEQVAFIFGQFGGFTGLAVRQYLNDNKIPQLFGATAADIVGDPERYPWTIGLNPAISTEAHIYAKYILANNPNGKIAVLYQNDALGKGFVTGMHEGVGAANAPMIVKEASYELSDPTVDSQIITLQGSGADTLIIGATNKAAAQAIRKAADLGWSPDRFLFNGASSIVGTLKPAGLEKSKGVITANYGKDPNDPRWKDDPGIKQWQAFASKYLNAADFTNVIGLYGFTAGLLIAQVLKQCGDDLSRENIMRPKRSISRDSRGPEAFLARQSTPRLRIIFRSGSCGSRALTARAGSCSGTCSPIEGRIAQPRQLLERKPVREPRSPFEGRAGCWDAP
jgi:ABC-type branched-subunit amino acid transport system substrate-binding protein